MYLQTLNQKTQQTSKMKERFCKGKNADDVTIPDAWGLSNLQRDFIESMIDKKTK